MNDEQRSPDLECWRANVYPITFQAHAAGMVFSGWYFSVNGHNTCLIDGNGDVRYSAEQGKTQPGRPMPLVFWSVSDVDVRNYKIMHYAVTPMDYQYHKQHEHGVR